MELIAARAVLDDGRQLLRLAGALDLQSKAVLVAAAAEVFGLDDATGLVLDLSEVNFIDSSGLGALISVADMSEEVGMSFTLRNPSHRVQRIIQVTGLDAAWASEVTG